MANDTEIVAQTSEGSFKFTFKRGFITNFRSGGVFVDGFIDQVGDEQKSIIYLLHDAMYTPCYSFNGEHPVTRSLADEFLRDGLAWAGMSKIKRTAVYCSVRLFGAPAYEDDDELTASNSVLFKFHWEAE